MGTVAFKGHGARQEETAVTLRQVLSNSFGFGGTNASLVLKRWEGA